MRHLAVGHGVQRAMVGCFQGVLAALHRVRPGANVELRVLLRNSDLLALDYGCLALSFRGAAAKANDRAGEKNDLPHDSLQLPKREQGHTSD